MAFDEPLQFDATAPAAHWNARLRVDRLGLFKAVWGLTKAYLSGDPKGVVDTALGASQIVKLADLTPGELGWLLIRRSLERAIRELSVEALTARGVHFERLELEEPVARLDGQLAEAKIRVGHAFFERPADDPIVEVVKPPLKEWFVALGLGLAEAETVNRRLGAYLTFALRREWAAHAEAYAPLEAELRKYENRFAKAEASERAWLRHFAWLQQQVHEALFDEDFGLAQVYVPLRAWYGEPVEEDDGPRPRQGELVRPSERRIVVNLRRTVLLWLASQNPKDTLRVVCGGPGSGKSSFAKMLAAELASREQRVLYVPLHHLRLRDEIPNIQALLNEFLRDRQILPHDPLDPEHGGRDLLLMFDGLDELSMQGRAGQELAASFVREVRHKLDALNGRHRAGLVKALLGGRDIAVEAAKLPPGQVLHVLPYHGSDPDEFAEGKKLLKRANKGRDRWWQHCTKLIGEPLEAMPKKLEARSGEDISAQPLLNYLLALSWRQKTIDFGAEPSRNEVYASVLKSIYERKWGGGHHPSQELLEEDDFLGVLEEIALAVWQGTGRTISETALVQACKDAGLGEQLGRFRAGATDAKKSAVGLLAAFYFRQAGQIVGGDRTFEFTHKSFGEYLTARRLVNAIEEIDAERAHKQSRRSSWDEKAVLQEWCRLTGPAAIDRDLLPYLKREVALWKAKDQAAVERWRQNLCELFSHQLHHGLPMETLGLSTFLEMRWQARNAEEALLAAHFCCADAVERSSDVDWPHQHSLRELISRLRPGRRPWITGDCLGRLDFRGSETSAPTQTERTAPSRQRCTNPWKACSFGAFRPERSVCAAALATDSTT